MRETILNGVVALRYTILNSVDASRDIILNGFLTYAHTSGSKSAPMREMVCDICTHKWIKVNPHERDHTKWFHDPTQICESNPIPMSSSHISGSKTISMSFFPLRETILNECDHTIINAHDPIRIKKNMIKAKFNLWIKR